MKAAITQAPSSGPLTRPQVASSGPPTQAAISDGVAAGGEAASTETSAGLNDNDPDVEVCGKSCVRSEMVTVFNLHGSDTDSRCWDAVRKF